ncbi:MAG: PAS domain-containing protein [Proteobacteria bacterium]|nr:PAS domain-containing protein [Pseudomonadota bacterium]
MPQTVTSRGTGNASVVDTLNEHGRRTGLPFRYDTKFIFDHPELKFLHDAWMDKAKGGALPFRADFDMQSLKPVISNIMIVERHQEEGATLYRVRLAGFNVTAVFGDMNGQLLDEALLGKFAPRWQLCVDAALDFRQPFRLAGNFEIAQASYLGGEIFIAPMRNAAGQATMILCGIYFHSKID